MHVTKRGSAWWFLARWSFATIAGSIVGMFGAIVLSYLIVNLFYPKETNLIVGLCVGAAVGAGQIVAARPWFRLTKSWIWGAALIMGPPFVAHVVFAELGWSPEASATRISMAAIAVAGAVAGSWIQALALREHSAHPRWWIAASPLAWGVAYALSDVAGTVGSALLLGLASGTLVLWIVRLRADDNTTNV